MTRERDATTYLDLAGWIEPALPHRRAWYGEGALQFGELRLPRTEDLRSETGYPVVMFVHGGGWESSFDLTYSNKLIAAITALGFATWNIEYRRVGNLGGGWPGTFQDIAAAADHLRELAREHPLDLSRIVASGHSAGGHLCLWAAGRRNLSAQSALYAPDPLDVCGVVALAPIPDLARYPELVKDGFLDPLILAVTGTTGTENQADLSSRLGETSPRHMGAAGVRQVLIVGNDDATVPPAVAEEFASLAAEVGSDVEVRVVEAGHFDLADPDASAWEAIASELLRVSDLSTR